VGTIVQDEDFHLILISAMRGRVRGMELLYMFLMRIGERWGLDFTVKVK
jgi:hypothetical protein